MQHINEKCRRYARRFGVKSYSAQHAATTVRKVLDRKRNGNGISRTVIKKCKSQMLFVFLFPDTRKVSSRQHTTDKILYFVDRASRYSSCC